METKELQNKLEDLEEQKKKIEVIYSQLMAQIALMKSLVEEAIKKDNKEEKQ